MLGLLLWTALPLLVSQLACFIFFYPIVHMHRLNFLSLVYTTN